MVETKYAITTFGVKLICELFFKRQSPMSIILILCKCTDLIDTKDEYIEE